MSDDGERPLSIGELADASGRTVDTLRYYEEEGLIPDVRRNEAGHRRYTREHVDWMRLLDRLRASGMPIAWMRRYTQLVEEGPETARERIGLLGRHADELEEEIASLEECLEVVRAKIDYYRELEENPEAVWRFPS